MQIPDEQKSIPTQCYVNGQLKTLTFKEAYVLFWEVPLSWLLPLDWFRFHQTHAYMRDMITLSTKMFAYNLFTRGYQTLTTNSDCMLDERGDGPSRNVFQARASKFAKIFGDDVPFIYDNDIVDRKRTIPAYRMKFDQKWLLVIGLIPETKIKPSEIDWTFFQTPPGGKEKEAVIKTLVEKGYL